MGTAVDQKNESLNKQKIFLQAEWRKLVIINYEIDPTILQPYLPRNVELDYFGGTCLVSLVGFMFNNTRIKGIRFPFHTDFEEFNLRFYVKYIDGDVIKRGVVFISELVPKFIIPIIANSIYRENYSRCPMSHSIEESSDHLKVSYSFQIKNVKNSVMVEAAKPSEPIKNDSVEEFITEHYWGYNKWNANSTMEYGVEHPKWETYKVIEFKVDCRFEDIYPKEFCPYLYATPHSVILAEGSKVLVRNGRII